MEFSEQYLDFLYEFHVERDYFECHEILEKYWQSMSYFPNKNHGEIALLQLSVALYHWRRHNYRGALSLINKVYENLENTLVELVEKYDLIGLTIAEDISDIRYLIETEQEYYDYCLPISDELMKIYCDTFAFTTHNWNAPSDMENVKLINKHRFQNNTSDEVKIYRFVGKNNTLFNNVLEIRHDVFAKEQGYDEALDPDEIDIDCYQYIAFNGETPVSVGRVFQNDDAYQIGRMATQYSSRGKGFAQAILNQMITDCKLQQFHSKIVAHAQLKALPMYVKNDFVIVSDQYLEEGQPHQTVEYYL